MEIKLYNTLTRNKDIFTPIEPGKAKIYCCGPTVYNYAHIGNMRPYVFEDLLKRMFIYNGYEVNHVVNITDVGHLQSDEDEGEDKMELGSQREGKTAWELAEYYTQAFMKDIKSMNILEPSTWCKATDHIKEQIDLIKCLEKKSYTYITNDGVYFDSIKFPDYGKLALLDIEGLEEGKRIQFSDEKKHKTDFALWKFSPKDKKRQMEWESPWGIGFPGWHVECSAMSMKYLGETFDIHCGGVDHIPIHHTNEIAQSEACTGKKFVNYWMHNEFLIMESEKMSKSSGEFLRLQTIIDKGYDPLDYRYCLMTTHYRKKIQFNWDNLGTAKNAHSRLKQNILRMRSENLPAKTDNEKEQVEGYKDNFLSAINDDINAPQTLAVLWNAVRDETISDKAKLELISDFDKFLGLSLDKVEEKKTEAIPEEITSLVNQRTEAKKNKDFKLADEIRNKIKELGYEVIDKKEGIEIKKS
jgi:cysteinyl-tRNA synthetase